MINQVIDWSLRNRGVVLLLAAASALWGSYAVRTIAVDAIPDLSDVQVIVKTSYPGQSPRLVEDQITYPLSTALMAVPGATSVRGFSFFGDSYLYVLFEEATDLYWARSRVLEYLNQASDSLPAGVQPTLGPDATGVGWIYEYALRDSSGQHSLADLRSIQDWFLKFELQSLPGVAEVATIGGMVKQYQVVVEPAALDGYGLTLADVRRAIARGNGEAGGAVLEMAEAEYMVRATGYIQSEQDLERIVLTVDATTPVTLADVAQIRIGPAMRRGIAELDGQGEVVGGVIVMRSGENARLVIDSVKRRVAQLRSSLPDGVELVETYDRSALIDRAVDNLGQKLIEEFTIVVVVCALFLLHLRSSLVIVISLALGILLAFAVMRIQGLNANVMSLGGIAIAIGAMVDAAIVLIENLHRRMAREDYDPKQHWQVVSKACREVGPPLFFSLLIITLSFLPVFALQAQEGRLFSPLAYTKTYAMAAAAGLAVTLVPVLMGYLVRGRIRPEQVNPINRGIAALYRPLIHAALRHPVLVLLAAMLLLVSSSWPLLRIGSEFMPDLNEGDLLYMPTTLPSLSIGKAQQLLQQTDKLIASHPEVAQVFGKIGRAESATDPAPLTMIETVIRLKSPSQWRPGVTIDVIKRELDERVDIPGLSNAWVWPIKTRIDMLATGVKTPVGIKVTGPDLSRIEAIGRQLEGILSEVPGTLSAFAERVAAGRYLTIDIDRAAAARYGLNIADVHEVVAAAIGGRQVAWATEGLERYPINVRYPRDTRNSLSAVRELSLRSSSGAELTLDNVAEVRIESGPPVIKSENARPSGWLYIDISGVDLAGYIEQASAAIAEQLTLPAGYSLTWTGQYQYLQRAKARLMLIVPFTLLTIVLLLWINFRRVADVAIVLGSMPLALVGGIWFLYWLQFNWSIAVGVGFIALAGVAVETAVVMLMYLQQAVRERQPAEQWIGTRNELREAIAVGAERRLRPIVMTVATIVVGLLPIMLGTGTGSEVMQRIAAPMVGGIVSATALTLIIVPVLFYLWAVWRQDTASHSAT